MLPGHRRISMIARPIAGALANQVVMHGGSGQQSWNGGIVRNQRPGRKGSECRPPSELLGGIAAKPVQGRLADRVPSAPGTAYPVSLS